LQELPPVLEILGQIAARQGRFDEAEARYLRAIAMLEEQSPDDPTTGLALADLARVYRDAGRRDQAETSFRDAIRRMEAVWGPEDTDVRRAQSDLEQLLSATGA
jgi:tetratricopeptide (TPR) repeat protein